MSALAGLRVWVTRPAHQAEPLCRAIEASGGHALRQPLLAIEDMPDRAAAIAALNEAARVADVCLFTSANAVARAFSLVPGLDPAGAFYAVGRATAAALAQASGRTAATPANDYSSEGLLALPAFARVAGQRIALITGAGGRGRLDTELAHRGAAVQRIEVYCRQPVVLAPARRQALIAEADAIVITSGEALDHLVASTPAAQADELRRRQLVVPSSRVLKMARDLGFSTMPLRPQRMDDAAVVDTLKHWVAADGRAGKRIG